MKYAIYRSDQRGKAKTDWLDTRYSFSFSNYFNPKRMGFGVLRVLNQDIFGPGKGFGFHEHNDMEIVTIVLEGALEHRDNQGHHGVIKEWEVQAMSAGASIVHSEVNHSKTKPVHLLQIWVDTKEQGIKPSYAQKKLNLKEAKNKFLEIVSGTKNKKSLYIHQDAHFFICDLEATKTVSYEPKKKTNGLFLFVISGRMFFEGELFLPGDSLEITELKSLMVSAIEATKILAIEVPLENSQ